MKDGRRRRRRDGGGRGGCDLDSEVGMVGEMEVIDNILLWGE